MLDKSAHAVPGYDPVFVLFGFFFFSSYNLKLTEKKKKNGAAILWEFGGFVVEGKRGRWATDDRNSPIPLESPPILGYSLSVSLETGFGLFRIHEGRDKTAD